MLKFLLPTVLAVALSGCNNASPSATKTKTATTAASPFALKVDGKDVSTFKNYTANLGERSAGLGLNGLSESKTADDKYSVTIMFSLRDGHTKIDKNFSNENTYVTGIHLTYYSKGRAQKDWGRSFEQDATDYTLTRTGSAEKLTGKIAAKLYPQSGAESPAEIEFSFDASFK